MSQQRQTCVNVNECKLNAKPDDDDDDDIRGIIGLLGF